MIFPQPLMLALCALIPAYFIYFKKRHDLAIKWLAIIVVLDIFNSQLYMNLSAILIFGMIVIPYLWMNRKSFTGNSATKLLGIYLIYLTLLGVYHGFIFPWADPTGLRSIKDQAQFRTILHLGRTFCEWSAMLYLTLQIERSPNETLNRFLKVCFYCSILLVISTALEKWGGIDFYHFFTGGRSLLIYDRPRGFDYEPRGLSQNLAYAILLTPFAPLGKWRYAFIPIFAIFAFYVTISFTGLMVLLTGLGILFLIFLSKKRSTLMAHSKILIASTLGLTFLVGALLTTLPKVYIGHLEERLGYFAESDVAKKLEVFDAASVNFLNHNPKYYFLGTGPGLIYLPAGDSILPRDQPIWGNHFEALPHMGAVLILSNSGLIGLLFFLFILWVGARSKMRKEDFILLVIGCMLSGIFLIQLHYYFIFGFACLFARTRLSLREEKLS